MADKETKRADIIEQEKPQELSLRDYLRLDRYPDWLWQRLNWFQDLKFGLFMHWGIYCQWNCIESWPLVKADTWARPDDLQVWNERNRDFKRFCDDYRSLNKTFNPRSFQPEAWADAAKNAGMKYVAFTTKHHDGFCMFDTQTTDYRVTHESCPFHTNPRANIAKEVFDAFHQEDFAITCYFSKSDWHCPWYWAPEFGEAPNRNPNYDTHAHPDVWQKFQDFVYSQIQELMTDYGHIDVLWLDGGQVRPPDQDILMDKIAAMARRLQPGLLIADRTVGGFHENILTPEQEIPDQPLGHPWESCMTMGNGWSYREGDTYKPCSLLLKNLINIVSKGGCFLLNIGPDPDGNFAPEALKRLEEIGEWMKVNGDAIYATRAVAPYTQGELAFTQKNNFVYAFCPLEDVETAALTIPIHSFRLKPGTSVTLLGSDAALDVKGNAAGFTVSVPRERIPCKHYITLKFEPERGD